MRFRYFIGRSLYLFATCLLLAGCEQEAALSDQSVVDLGAVQRNRTELDESHVLTVSKSNIVGIKTWRRTEATPIRRKPLM